MKKYTFNINSANRISGLSIIFFVVLSSFTNVSCQYELTLRTDGTPGASVSPSGSVMVQNGEPTIIQVTSIPDGYDFTMWTEEFGIATIDDAFASVTNVTLTEGDATVQANFSLINSTAELSGSNSICSGESANLELTLTGNSPWEVVYTDGNEDFTITDITSSPHTFTVSPETTTTYSLIAVKDEDNNLGDVSGNATVTVSPLSEGGIVSGNSENILLSQSTGTLTLSGHTGTVLRWQKRVNDGSWNNITNTETTYSETPESTGTYYYRAVVQSGVCAADNSDPFVITVSNSPVLEDADYDASNGTLTINGQNLHIEEYIDVTKLTVSNGINSYSLTNQTTNIKPSSSSRATIILEEREKAFLNWIFNNNGSRSKDDFTYNLSATENWNGRALEDQFSPVAVFNYLPPVIESATYNTVTAELDVTASGLAASTEPVNDIDATKFTITGKNNDSYTLTEASPGVNVLSDKVFIIIVGESDKEELAGIIDIGGSISSTGHPYKLIISDRWNVPVHEDYDISDLTGKELFVNTFDNYPPVASNVEITGVPDIGNTLSGSYDYSDPENDPESSSQYAWYVSSSAEGANEEKIEGENDITYTVKSEDAGKYLAFEVIPVASLGTLTGDPVKSGYIAVNNAPPEVFNVSVSGTPAVCKDLTVNYEYSDPEGDTEGDTEIMWLRAEDITGTNEETIHEGPVYTATIDDEGKFIRVRVTPAAASGTPAGTPVTSDYVGPVENRLPSVSISAPDEFCPGTPVDITFELTGTGPWTVYYTDGINEFSFETISSPHLLPVSSGGTYKVTALIDGEGCEGTELGNELEIKALSVIKVGNWYIEQFEDNQSEWTSYASPDNLTNSWTYGQPGDDVFTSASAGGNIWYTDIVTNNIPEQSWVASPCFDFTEAIRPMIAIDLWREFGNNSNGAVLQYSTNNSGLWNNIGDHDQGINWYNSTEITGLPGGQSTGWTIPGQANESGWEESRHDLDMLTGQEVVRFRIAYGSDGTGASNEGLAFDNVRIGERSKVVLLEHFTNATHANSIESNTIVNDVANSQKQDIIHINYHTSFPNSDPIHDQNAADPASRVLYYSVSDVPFSIMDGGLDGEGQFDYTSSVFNRNDLIKRALTDPLFTIDISQDQSGDELSIDVELTPVINIDLTELTLHVAIIETEVSASQLDLPGNTIYRNIVRKLLPDAGGTALPANWSVNQPESFTFNWTIDNVIDGEKLALVAFIQDESSKEIYQTGYSLEFGIPLSADKMPTSEDDGSEILFYPNPANEYLLINLGKTSEKDLKLEVYDISGKMMYSEILKEGIYTHETDISNLSRGIYLFMIKSNSQIKVKAGIVIIN